MRSSTRSALPTVLAILCCATSLFAQSPVKQPAAKTPGGSVSGRITIKEKPAAGVLVVLRKGETGSAWEPVAKALTDQSGVYHITNVPPGGYTVTPSTPAYIAADKVSRKMVVVAEDENVEGINFSLVRGGVITGKVTDADGRPVIQQQVEFYPAENFEQRQPAQTQSPPRPMYPARTVQTDDRGIYRVFGLMPGRYKVSSGRSENSTPSSFSMSPITYTQVFHPDAKDSAKATVIEVSEGSEATNVDITLGATLQMFSASGRVLNSESGAPVPQVRFGLHRLHPERPEYTNHNVSSNARGEFTIEGLTPGKYGVFLFTEPGGGTQLRAERTTFEVIDQDVTGVTIKLSKGGVITGLVVLESDDKVAQRKFLELKVHGYVDTFPGTSVAVASQLGPDGSFRLTGLPGGFVNFAIFPTGSYAQSPFVITRIERDGVTTPRLELKNGETVNGVKMFIRYGTASVRGTITFQNGTLPPGTRMMVRLSQQGATLPYNRQAEVDSRGQFFIENIAAGVYELRTTVFGFNKARTLDQKTEVSLTDGLVSNVTIIIDVSTVGIP